MMETEYHCMFELDNPRTVLLGMALQEEFSPWEDAYWEPSQQWPLLASTTRGPGFPQDSCCCCCWVTSVVSDSVRPQRRQPTRLPCPLDPPGKNTGVGCHFLLQCMTVKSESEVTQSCPTLCDPMDCSPIWLLRPWDFPGKSTGVGCHRLLCQDS